ncbi:AraC family transcriptional regulator [Lysobacter sp. S4-A87]|uniref:AraC family transcriptional regulator n=1 Tax=Lysobacter sp. S4-A87 TaxID=2925843 RepID=UPI001F53184F|nr:AraC family transcriptional regulator [Lysobacter sp. S4-A87]UNK48349.1 AraC family transcriptional regulator [Lysobacter sp. S4-A87]
MRVAYQPPGEYGLDVEIFTVADLRGRVDDAHFRVTQRIGFHMLICVTEGHFDYTVDFTAVQCRPGSLLALRPGQALHFNMQANWNGWVVIFRPEFLAPLQTTVRIDELKAHASLQALPSHMALEGEERHAVLDTIVQMHADCASGWPLDELHPLLRHQLYSLLLRLHLSHGRQAAQSGASVASLNRFRRFQQLLEANFAHQHQVAAYAKALGCSERSLTRTTLDVAGVQAKAFIAARINLEAKRLLAQTALPIAAIAEQLGFDEAANFIKFFKRDAGCAPGEFRRQHLP